MARNPLASTICAVCGAKFNAERDRCPRCRAKFEPPDREALVAAAKAAAARSHRLQVIGLSALCIALVGTAGVWMLVPTRQSEVVRPASVDPLAARRATPPRAANTAQPSAPKGRAFMDASGKAHEAFMEGDIDSALHHYKDALTNNPNDAETLSNLGQLLVREGHADQALAYFNRAIQLNPDRWAYIFNRGRANAVLERWAESIADYRRAQELFPNDYATTFNLAQALHKSGDDDAAVKEYQKAIDLAPDDPSFRMALGISLEKLDRRVEAASAYQEALKLNPTAPDADKVKERIAVLSGAPLAAGSAPKLLN
jgi:Flp pilus assembly protein TadD